MSDIEVLELIDSSEDSDDSMTEVATPSQTSSKFPRKVKLSPIEDELKRIYNFQYTERTKGSIIIAVHNIGPSCKRGLKVLYQEIQKHRIDICGVVDVPESSHLSTLKAFSNVKIQKISNFHIPIKNLEAVKDFGFGNSYCGTLISNYFKYSKEIEIKTWDFDPKAKLNVREDIACGFSLVALGNKGYQLGMLTFYAAPRLFSAKAAKDNAKDFVDFNHWKRVFLYAVNYLKTNYRYVVVCGDANCDGPGWGYRIDSSTRLTDVIGEMAAKNKLKSHLTGFPQVYDYSFIPNAKKENVIRLTVKYLELQRNPEADPGRISLLESIIIDNTTCIDLLFTSENFGLVRKIPTYPMNSKYIPDHTICGYELKLLF